MAYGTSTDGSYYDEELMAEWRYIFDPTNTFDENGADSFEKKWWDKFGQNNTASPWTGYTPDAYLNPEKLRYWLDIIDTTSSIGKYSVQRIGRRSVVTEDSKVNEVFSREINDIVFVEAPVNEEDWEKAMDKVKKEYIPIGQTYSFIQSSQWSMFKEINSYGTCYEGVRNQLYQYIVFNSSVNVTTIPLLYLTANECLRISFPEFGIVGDFVVNTISFNFSNQPTMTLGLQEAFVIT